MEDEWAAVAERDENVKLSEGWRVFEINSGDAGDDSSENYGMSSLTKLSMQGNCRADVYRFSSSKIRLCSSGESWDLDLISI